MSISPSTGAIAKRAYETGEIRYRNKTASLITLSNLFCLCGTGTVQYRQTIQNMWSKNFVLMMAIDVWVGVGECIGLELALT